MGAPLDTPWAAARLLGVIWSVLPDRADLGLGRSSGPFSEPQGPRQHASTPGPHLACCLPGPWSPAWTSGAPTGLRTGLAQVGPNNGASS